MNPERMKERGVYFSKRERAILEGWKLVFNKVASKNPNEGYANIEKEEGDIVEGILYEIEESDLEKKLHCYEGFPDHYDIVTVKVKLDNGQEVEAKTYIATEKWKKDGLKPSKSYLEHLLKGSDLLSNEYVEKLKKIETID